jgi:ABC-type oligopeptide transport system substrate-binding subunit
MTIQSDDTSSYNPTTKGLSRRDILIIGAGAVSASSTLFATPGLAAQDSDHYGLSAFGDLQYPADFKDLEYVNPSAPKGGVFSQLAGAGTATFNSFNGFILKGDAAVDMEQVFAALMWRARRGLCLRRRQGHGVGRRPRLQVSPAGRHHLA